MTSMKLAVPDEEQSLEVGKEYYQFQMAQGGYDPTVSVEDHLYYQQFKDSYESYGEFVLTERVTHAITDVVGPELESVSQEYRDEDWVVWDPAGLKQFIDALEDARERLAAEDDLHEATEQTINQAINLVRFARDRGYGVIFSQ